MKRLHKLRAAQSYAAARNAMLPEKRSRLADRLRKALGWVCGCAWVILATAIAVAAFRAGAEGLVEGQLPWSLHSRGRSGRRIVLIGTEARLLGFGLMLLGSAFAGSALAVVAGRRLTGSKAAAAFWAIFGCFLTGGVCGLAGMLLWAVR